jgi:NitT/TauT family transport system substrate-binding protein
MTAGLLPLITQGDVRLIGWVGDETPWQYGVVVASTKLIERSPDLVERFLKAYRKGARDYHDAFAGPDETRHDGPTAPDMLKILAKYTKQPEIQLKSGIPYLDADARLDVKDVLRQVAWYRSQGLVKGPVEGEAIIDTRFAQPLPER